MSRHIAVIGGGYSGTLQAINLLRHGNAEVSLIERSGRPARGVAYSTSYRDHLLNVRAGRMSAFADAPGHFADWLARSGGGDAASFAERRVYGRYLEELLAEATAQAGGRLRIASGEAVAVVPNGGGERVKLADGSAIEADVVILSVGNLPPPTPPQIAPDLPPSVFVADPWAGDIAANLSEQDRVLLIGTGLTAIDAALMLDAAGFRGEIVAISRRGLVPRAHEEEPHERPNLPERPRNGCLPLLRFLREESAAIGWHAAVDQMRPHTQALWASAPVEERRRFLRHLRPWWDVHRHRIAPEIAARLRRMEAEGRLTFRAGKLISTAPDGEVAVVTWRPRGSETGEQLAVRRIVNCTGPEGDIRRAGEPLLAQLLEAGRIRPDPCRIGIDIDQVCRTLDANGAPSKTLYAIGPMTRGALWEIVAVPDIREQVDALARRITAAA